MYKILNFILLFIGIFATNYFTFTDKNPYLASISFTILLGASWLLKKEYNSRVECIQDERTELIEAKMLRNGYIALTVTLMYELIWKFTSLPREEAVGISLFLFPPLLISVTIVILSKLYYERVM